MKRIYVIYTDAGGGHRSLMETLTTLIKNDHSDARVESIDLFELFRQLPVFSWFPKKCTVLAYNKCPTLLLNINLFFFTYFTMRIKGYFSKQIILELLPFWKEKKPDLVISTYPGFNDILHQSLNSTESKFLTFIADYGEFYPNLWIVPQDQYYICNESCLYKRILDMGGEAKKVLKTSGFLIPERFYQPHYLKKDTYRKSLNLNSELFTIVSIFGAYGSSEQSTILKSLNKIRQKLQLIFVIGKNRKIPKIFEKPSHHNILTISFTNELEKIFASSDLLIGKPSPGVISQAIAQQLPVIVKNNLTTLYQERFVAEWIKKHEIGLTIKNFSSSGKIIEQLINSTKLEKIKENVMKMENNAYKEISKFINDIIIN
jgi:1,2-diacylglycerol 3-beta-galactosyltransferase